jgi:hypothetical protein
MPDSEELSMLSPELKYGVPGTNRAPMEPLLPSEGLARLPAACVVGSFKRAVPNGSQDKNRCDLRSIGVSSVNPPSAPLVSNGLHLAYNRNSELRVAPWGKRMSKVKQSSSPEPPGGKTRRMTVMTIKGTVEWKEWLDRFADFSRLPSTVLIDIALAEWAKQRDSPNYRRNNNSGRGGRVISVNQSETSSE